MSDYLDRYGRSRSVCHALPPRVKLLVALGTIAVAVSIPPESWPLLGLVGCVVFAGHTLAGIPMTYLLRRMAVFVPMVCLLSISLPLSQGFSGGWTMMFAVLARSIVSFGVAIWLVNVMPFDQMLVTLRRLGMPDTLTSVLAFMYRYAFVMWDELEKMRTARRARMFGRRGLWFRWRTSAQLIGMLLLRAMSRAERVHGAMRARNWDGRIRVLDR